MPHHTCCLLSLLLFQQLLCWMLSKTSFSQLYDLAGSICPCSNNGRSSQVCSGDYEGWSTPFLLTKGGLQEGWFLQQKGGFRAREKPLS